MNMSFTANRKLLCRKLSRKEEIFRATCKLPRSLRLNRRRQDRTVRGLSGPLPFRLFSSSSFHRKRDLFDIVRDRVPALQQQENQIH